MQITHQSLSLQLVTTTLPHPVSLQAVQQLVRRDHIKFSRDIVVLCLFALEYIRVQLTSLAAAASSKRNFHHNYISLVRFAGVLCRFALILAVCT